MSEDQNPESPKIPPHANRATALSLFDQAGGANDFPVLKAFQEYIDAEQARSRKRMLNLSIFFFILLVVVVVTFSVIMAAIINRDQQNLSTVTARNQELSDKLLDIALRERSTTQQPVVNVQPAVPTSPQPSSDSLLKPLIDKIENLASTLSTTQHPTARSPQQASAESPEVARLRAELARQKKALESMRAEREKIKAERQVLKAEREKLRQEQVEQHRRRLYPEHYAREEAIPLPAAPKAMPTPTPTPPPPVKKIEPTKKPETAKPVAAAKPLDLKTVKPISYFDDADEAPAVSEQKKSAPESKPEPVNEKKTTTLNVSSQDGETIPFLIELPESSK